MSKPINYYISNSLWQIITAECSPQMLQTLCDDLADAFVLAGQNGVGAGHGELQKLATDASRGKYKTGLNPRMKR